MDIVTGAAGFIGSNLSEKLVRNGREVLGIDNFHEYYDEEIKRENIREVSEAASKSDGSFKLREASITNLEEAELEADNVYHLAAVAGVRNSFENPHQYHRLNTLGTSKLLESIADMRKFVFVSSSSVYGQKTLKQLPAQEDDMLDPSSPYALSKRNAERLVRMRSTIQDFEFTVARPFSVYGPRQRPDQVITKFINMALNEEPLTIYGDGEQSRDFTYVKDFAEGLIKAGRRGEGVYNLGSNRRVSVNEFVDTLEEVLDVEVERKYLKKPEEEAEHTLADISRAERHLDYSPDTGFREGLKRQVEWVKQMRRKEIL